MSKIGVDIGGTTIKGILFDNGVVKTHEEPTYGNVGLNAILNSLFKVIDNLFNKEVGFIGVSSAGNIDPYNGVCVYATDNLLGFTGLNIKSTIQQRYGVDCTVDNDAICALKCEVDGLNVQSAVMVTFGTGIGGAVIINGKILRGKNFDGGRLGHMCLVPDGMPCNCGKYGCVESYLSCTALLKESKKFISDIKDCKQLFDLYLKGNQLIVPVIDQFSHYLNIFLDNLRTCYGADLIILGGGLMNGKDVVEKLIIDKKDIVFAQHGNLAGCLGALKQII